jgi:hypothetical protein
LIARTRLGGDPVTAAVDGRRDNLHRRFHCRSGLCWRKDLRAFVVQPRLSVSAPPFLQHVGLGGGPEACGRGNILRRAGDCISRYGDGLRRRARTAAVMIAISCSRLSHFRCDAADMARYWWGTRLKVMSHDLNPRRFGWCCVTAPATSQMFMWSCLGACLYEGAGKIYRPRLRQATVCQNSQRSFALGAIFWIL